MPLEELVQNEPVEKSTNADPNQEVPDPLTF
jgi:hypothetical protein